MELWSEKLLMGGKKVLYACYSHEAAFDTHYYYAKTPIGSDDTIYSGESSKSPVSDSSQLRDSGWNWSNLTEESGNRISITFIRNREYDLYD